MAKLNYMDRDNVLHAYELTEDLVTIGREATNKIVIADPSVSRQHAWVEKRSDGYYLIDKNSSNGSFVNGKKITEQKLNHNDKINLGNASMVFEDEEQIQATFILDRQQVPSAPVTAPTPAVTRDDKPTEGIEFETPARPAAPPPEVPPPSPSAAPQPPGPAPLSTAPTGTRPDMPPVLCPSCKKPVDMGSRFCGFCGAPIAIPKPPAAAPPPPPSPPRASAVPPSQGMQPPPAAKASAAPFPSPPPQPSFAPVPPVVPVGQLNYAGFGPRLAAYLIDSVLLLALLLLPMAGMWLSFFIPLMGNETPGPLAWVLFLVCTLATVVIGLWYNLYFVGAKGATPGKKIMKLKVTLPDGTWPIGYGKAFLRLIGYMISSMICYIGFLMIAFDKQQHRGLHDKIAGTVVIRES